MIPRLSPHVTLNLTTQGVISVPQYLSMLYQLLPSQQGHHLLAGLQEWATYRLKTLTSAMCDPKRQAQEC